MDLLKKADYPDYEKEGFAGWMLFGLLGVFNFMYYSDMFYNHYVTNNYASKPWIGFAFRTSQGMA
jgi:hypothetical protein